MMPQVLQLLLLSLKLLFLVQSQASKRASEYSDGQSTFWSVSFFLHHSFGLPKMPIRVIVVFARLVRKTVPILNLLLEVWHRSSVIHNSNI